MRIKALEIKNFRSFAETPSLLKFGDGINILVGENNVGKSNILKSLELLKSKRALTHEDFHKGETDREIRVTASIELNEKEIEYFTTNLLIGSRDSEHVRKIVSELKNAFELEYSSKVGDHIVKFHDFWVRGDHLYLLSNFAGGSYQTVEWDDIVKKFFDPDNNLPLLELMKKELVSKDKKKVIHFRTNVSEILRNMFDQNVKNFLEIRQCPSGSNQGVFESYDGALVADVLANLKNGNQTQRNKWKRIKQEFRNLFPSLELEVKKPAGETPQVMVVKETVGYEVPVSFVGAGIWEIVILLTHLFSFESMCFGMDMPELHFHHHTIRLLKNILKERSANNQFLIVVGGVAVFEAYVDKLSEEIDDIQAAYFNGITIPIEFHAGNINSGNGQRWRHVREETREKILGEVYDKIGTASFPKLVAFATALHISKAATNPTENIKAVFEDVCGRFNTFLVRQGHAGKPNKGLLIIDDAHREHYMDLVREFRRAGMKSGYLGKVVDIPYFSASKETRMLQLADFVAYAVYRYYEKNDYTYLGKIISRFDRRDKFHSPDGLKHMTKDLSCKCIDCSWRRNVKYVQPTLEDQPDAVERFG
jgi:hypothetical protein